MHTVTLHEIDVINSRTHGFLALFSGTMKYIFNFIKCLIGYIVADCFRILTLFYFNSIFAVKLVTVINYTLLMTYPFYYYFFFFWCGIIQKNILN